MVVSPNMAKEAEVIHQQTMQYRFCVSKDQAVVHQVDLAAPILRQVHVADSVSGEIARYDSVSNCSENSRGVGMDTPSSTKKFMPCISSGSCVDIGLRSSMEDEHIRIDDLSSELRSRFGSCTQSAFYAVFDGHGGPEAASYIKKNAMNLFFDKTLLPESSEINESFLNKLENSYRQAFHIADLALAEEPSVSSSCGTTALTALILNRHLFVANVGDCRAVLCRKGAAFEMSQDHRPSYKPELKRVEELGGFLIDGYLNGYLSITRALGDWDLKLPLGSASPLISEPDFRHATLTEEDEFLIIACDGVWDVMSSQYAVSVVRQGLRRHNDPQRCARELVMDALRLNTTDNLSVIVVCFSPADQCLPQRMRLRCCNLSEEARNKLRSLLGGN